MRWSCNAGLRGLRMHHVRIGHGRYDDAAHDANSTMETHRTRHLCAMSPIQTPSPLSPLTRSTRHAFAIRPQGWLCKGSHVTSCHFAQPPGLAARRKKVRTADCERVAESTFMRWLQNLYAALITCPMGSLARQYAYYNDCH